MELQRTWSASYPFLREQEYDSDIPNYFNKNLYYTEIIKDGGAMEEKILAPVLF